MSTAIKAKPRKFILFFCGDIQGRTMLGKRSLVLVGLAAAIVMPGAALVFTPSLIGLGARCRRQASVGAGAQSQWHRLPLGRVAQRRKLRMSSTVVDPVLGTQDLVHSGEYQGFHHLEFWVGNAKQTATWFIARMGFEPVAYSGLETGSRDTVTHVVQQGTVRFAFTSALNPTNTQISAHHAKHGDGVRDVAMRVKDCRATYKYKIAMNTTLPHHKTRYYSPSFSIRRTQ